MRETHASIDATLQDDDVRVVRHQVDRDYGAGDVLAHVFEDIEIEIPVRGEEVEIRKRPVVREHVVVRKILRERILAANETLQREQLHVEGDYIDDCHNDVRLERRRSGRSL